MLGSILAELVNKLFTIFLFYIALNFVFKNSMYLQNRIGL